MYVTNCEVVEIFSVFLFFIIGYSIASIYPPKCIVIFTLESS